MKGLINNFIKGLFKDTSSKEQPEGTTRFTLNAINNTYEGNLGALANENSNGECFSLPEGYVPLGKVYIGDGEVAILSTKLGSPVNEIGIIDSDCNYTTHVRADLGFKVTNQIDVTYRLRRGCNKTIYWVDGKNNPPMTYDFGNPGDFKTGAFWDKKKFIIGSTYSIYPEFTDISVLDGSGQLPIGSYNIGIQYVDESLNSTPIIFTSPTINIYKDLASNTYTDIQGSITSSMTAYNFGTTTKAISITSVVDESYAFYRLVFISYVNGDGSLTDVRYSQPIPTQIKNYIYDGENYDTLGDIEEVLIGDSRISAADSIEQIDNRLTLANIYGNTENPCSLQQVVSKINVDLIIKKVFANSLIPGNTKHPLVNFDSVGYMPGEIYSIGLVPHYEDNTEGPVYHIPGKNIVDAATVFSPGADVYPMSEDNTSASSTYIDNASCDTGDYWGEDSSGEPLLNSLVRHHRFPYRTDIGVPQIEKTSSNTSSQFTTKIVIEVTGTLDIPCTEDQVTLGECTTETIADPFQVRITFLMDGDTASFIFIIDPQNYADYPDVTAEVSFEVTSGEYLTDNITIVSVEEYDGLWVDVPDGNVSKKGLNYVIDTVSEEFSKTKNTYIANVYGIKLSNIDLAAMNAVSNKKIVGYHIVRNERTESNKTVLDSAILTPCVNSNNIGRYMNGYQDGDLWGPNTSPQDYNFRTLGFSPSFLSNGLLSPVFDRNHIDDTYSRGPVNFEGLYPGSDSFFLTYDNRVSKTFFGLLNPKYKFNDIQYDNPYRIKQQGVFNVVDRKYDGFMYQDINDETSYDKNLHKGKFEDNDGFSLRGITRDSELDFSLNPTGGNTFNFSQDDIEDISYLRAVHNKSYPSLNEDFWNLSGDNRTGILKVKDSQAIKGNMKDIYPYVYLEKNVLNPYDGFRTTPYYKISSKLLTGDTVEVFGGDTFITPLRYSSSLFIDNQIGTRISKDVTWKILVGFALAIIAVVAAFFTAGTTALALPQIIGFMASGVKEQKLIDAYQTEYGRGLGECLMDADTFNGLKWNPSQDDEVQWFSDTLTDIWYESEVNISLRYGPSDTSESYFLDAPGEVSGFSRAPRWEINLIKYTVGGSFLRLHWMGKTTVHPATVIGKHLKNKLLESDTSRKNNLKYIGHSQGEIFEINPDFDRMNKEKVFFHLGIEYDCCSDCLEEFPHRVWYSEQSFQEELSDNYKIFLPFNYRDIDGETGRITDLFKMNNNLYIHTEGALWHLPQNYQERVTDQLTTFIGTGEFFAIPPRKILDDEQSSGGTQHKWATNKNEHGVFFISESERKIYRFDGKNLRTIVTGLSKWFLDNIRLKVNKNFKNKNNPSNPKGVGFISIYDAEKERVIFTKKDYSTVDGTDILFDPDLGYYTQEGEICGKGYTYDPEKQICYKEEEVEKQPVGEGILVEPAGTSSHGFDPPAIYTTYNSDGTADVDPLSSTGYTYESLANPWWVGGGVVSQRYVNLLAKWVSSANLDTWYGGVKIVDVPSTKTYYVALAADDEFRFSVDGVVILTSNAAGMNPQHNRSFGAPFVKIHIYPIELEAGCRLIKVEGLNEGSSGLFAASILDNTYSEIVNSSSQTDLNEVYSTQYVTELFADGFTMECPEDSVPLGKGICDKCLARDEKPLNITRIDFENKEYFNDSSWTMSYALPNEQRQGNIWVSWHSYMPRFYLKNEGKFYSWQNVSQDNSFWEHNIKDSYQEFYGKKYPFIIEFVSADKDLKTKLWEYISIRTQATKFNTTLQEHKEERFVTFNKAIFYNSRQSSGELNIVVKDTKPFPQDYLIQQVQNLSGDTIIIDKDEKDWHINDLRDYVINQDEPLFDKNKINLQSDYFIDKIVNNNVINHNKDWFDVESFRDKYLTIRLIFDNFDDVKLLFTHAISHVEDSER